MVFKSFSSINCSFIHNFIRELHVLIDICRLPKLGTGGPRFVIRIRQSWMFHMMIICSYLKLLLLSFVSSRQSVMSFADFNLLVFSHVMLQDWNVLERLQPWRRFNTSLRIWWRLFVKSLRTERWSRRLGIGISVVTWSFPDSLPLSNILRSLTLHLPCLMFRTLSNVPAWW